MKRSPLRSRPHRVTPEERAVYLAVEQRDQGCMAPRLDPESGPCDGRLTRQHVKDGPGGPRVTDEAHLLMLCEGHHTETRAGRQWATSDRGLALQRDHLRRLYPAAWSGC